MNIKNRHESADPCEPLIGEVWGASLPNDFGDCAIGRGNDDAGPRRRLPVRISEETGDERAQRQKSEAQPWISPPPSCR